MDIAGHCPNNDLSQALSLHAFGFLEFGLKLLHDALEDLPGKNKVRDEVLSTGKSLAHDIHAFLGLP